MRNENQERENTICDLPNGKSVKIWSNWFHHNSQRIARSRWAGWLLLILAFFDASIIPLPITALFLIFLLLSPKMSINYILLIIIGTLTGALAGYMMGHYAWISDNGEFTGIAKFLFSTIPGFSMEFYNKTGILYSKWGIWILSLATITPIPYGVFSISSGVFNINIFLFSIITLVCQVVKFSFLAIVTLKSGPLVKKIAEFNWKPVVIITIWLVIIILVSKTIR